MAYALLNLGGCAAQHMRSRGGRLAGHSHAAGAAVAVAALLALAVAGCFTGPINRRPEVTVTTTDSGPLLRKQAATFQMTVSDPDGDATPTLTWAVVPGDCADDTGPSSWPSADRRQTSSPQKQTLMLDGGDSTDGPFCVWAFATDTHNATGAGHLGSKPQNQAPTAKLGVVAPAPAKITTLGVVTYPLYSTIELTSQGTFDPEGDALVPAWSLDHIPGGSTAELRDCKGTDQCFTADVAGEYDVSLTVTDPSQAHATVSSKIFVNPDQPPCIYSSSPLLTTPMLEHDPSTQDVFQIMQVTDDGDPFPVPGTSTTQFRWYISRNGQPFVFYNNNFPSLTLAADTYGIGDSVKVRVEVLDRNPATAASLFGCGDDNDLCEMVMGSGCFQRVTWSVDFR